MAEQKAIFFMWDIPVCGISLCVIDDYLYLPEPCIVTNKYVTKTNKMHTFIINFLQINYPLHQRFSNFFQVGTTFISQNVLRTTLLSGLSNSLGLP